MAEVYVDLFARYLAAREDWRREHGAYPSRVYISPLAEARLRDQMSARIVIPFPWTAPKGLMAHLTGADWYIDVTMTGEGFRFAA